MIFKPKDVSEELRMLADLEMRQTWPHGAWSGI